MYQKFFSIVLVFCLLGCVSKSEPKLSSNGGPCPSVVIRSSDEAITQSASYQQLFKIEMVGYDGYCLFDDRVGKNKAIVAPRFKITRLSESNVEDVHFSYYLETAQGPTAYLGRKTYYTSARIAKGVMQVYHTAKEGELSIPTRHGGVDIYAGMNANRADSEFKSN